MTIFSSEVDESKYVQRELRCEAPFSYALFTLSFGPATDFSSLTSGTRCDTGHEASCLHDHLMCIPAFITGYRYI